MRTKGTDDGVLAEHHTGQTWNVQTANGTVASDLVFTAVVPGLGKQRFIKLPDSPDMLSMGQLVDDGFSFEWESKSRPVLTTPHGQRIVMDVVDNIPVIAQEATAAVVHAYFQDLEHVQNFFEYPHKQHCTEESAPHVDAIAAVGRLDASSATTAELPSRHFLTHMPMLDQCDVCQQAKIKRARHDRVDPSERRANHFGELVGTDLVGPTRLL